MLLVWGPTLLSTHAPLSLQTHFLLLGFSCFAFSFFFLSPSPPFPLSFLSSPYHFLVWPFLHFLFSNYRLNVGPDPHWKCRNNPELPWPTPLMQVPVQLPRPSVGQNDFFSFFLGFISLHIGKFGQILRQTPFLFHSHNNVWALAEFNVWSRVKVTFGLLLVTDEFNCFHPKNLMSNDTSIA